MTQAMQSSNREYMAVGGRRRRKRTRKTKCGWWPFNGGQDSRQNQQSRQSRQSRRYQGGSGGTRRM